MQCIDIQEEDLGTVLFQMLIFTTSITKKLPSHGLFLLSISICIYRHTYPPIIKYKSVKVRVKSSEPLMTAELLLHFILTLKIQQCRMKSTNIEKQFSCLLSQHKTKLALEMLPLTGSEFLPAPLHPPECLLVPQQSEECRTGDERGAGRSFASFWQQ